MRIDSTVAKQQKVHLIILTNLIHPYKLISNRSKNIIYILHYRCLIISYFFIINTISITNHSLLVRTGVTQKCVVPLYLFCVPMKAM